MNNLPDDYCSEVQKINDDWVLLKNTFPVGAAVEYLGIKGIILEHKTEERDFNEKYGYFSVFYEHPIVVFEYFDILENKFNQKALDGKYLRVLPHFKIEPLRA